MDILRSSHLTVGGWYLGTPQQDRFADPKGECLRSGVEAHRKGIVGIAFEHCRVHDPATAIVDGLDRVGANGSLVAAEVGHYSDESSQRSLHISRVPRANAAIEVRLYAFVPSLDSRGLVPVHLLEVEGSYVGPQFHEMKLFDPPQFH